MTPRVMIAIPTAEFARRADFYDYLNMLEKPDGTMMAVSHGQSPARNRNILIRQALQHNATHILFLDDDVAFKPTMLKKLLSHDKDIVGGLYLMRNFPHLPIMFDKAYDDGRCQFSFLSKGRTGLTPVVNMGLGACLIKTDLFRKMAEGHDVETFCWITLGEAEKDHWCDDISFFNRARKQGFELFVDLDVPIGHNLSATIWPERNEAGEWFTSYNTSAKEAFLVPQRVPTEQELVENLRGLGLVK